MFLWLFLVPSSRPGIIGMLFWEPRSDIGVISTYYPEILERFIKLSWFLIMHVERYVYILLNAYTHLILHITTDSDSGLASLLVSKR